MKLPNLKFSQVDSGYYVSNATTCVDNENTEEGDPIFHINKLDSRYEVEAHRKKGYELYMHSYFMGYFRTLREAIKEARNTEVNESVIELWTIKEYEERGQYILLNKKGFDVTGEFAPLKQWLCYYPHQIVRFDSSKNKPFNF